MLWREKKNTIIAPPYIHQKFPYSRASQERLPLESKEQSKIKLCSILQTKRKKTFIFINSKKYTAKYSKELCSTKCKKQLRNKES
jgi:hypothetical protein